jgi:hypothetical protein
MNRDIANNDAHQKRACAKFLQITTGADWNRNHPRPKVFNHHVQRDIAANKRRLTRLKTAESICREDLPRTLRPEPRDPSFLPFSKTSCFCSYVMAIAITAIAGALYRMPVGARDRVFGAQRGVLSVNYAMLEQRLF